MRIEEGKYYLNRMGEVVGPLKPNDRGGLYLWRDEQDRPYFHNGRAQVGENPHPNDLTHKWVDPNAPPFTGTAARQSTPPPPPLRAASDAARATTATPPPIPSSYSDGDPSYADLIRVLHAAHEQASRGKGRERHAKGQSFDRQPIMEIGRMVGPGFAAGQAMKKAQEASGMLERRDYRAAEAELLGAINYLAACVMLVREKAAA